MPNSTHSNIYEYGSIPPAAVLRRCGKRGRENREGGGDIGACFPRFSGNLTPKTSTRNFLRVIYTCFSVIYGGFSVFETKSVAIFSVLVLSLCLLNCHNIHNNGNGVHLFRLHAVFLFVSPLLCRCRSMCPYFNFGRQNFIKLRRNYHEFHEKAEKIIMN